MSTQPRLTRTVLARRLLRVARPVLAPLGISVVARLTALLAGVAIFAVAGTQVLAYASKDPYAWTFSVTLWTLVILSLAKAFLRYLEQFSGHWVAFRSLALLRTYFYDRLEPQAPALTDTLDSGDLMQRVTKDVDRVEVFFAHTLAPGLTAILVPPIVLIWMGQTTSWWLVLVQVPFLLLVGLLVPLLGAGACERAAGDARKARGELTHHVTDSVQGVREILAFGAEGRRREGMASIEERIGSAQWMMGRWIAERRGLNQALLGLSVVAVAWVGASLLSGGHITPAQLGGAIALALASFAPVLAVEDFAADLDQAWASARRIFEITDREPLISDPSQVSDAARACDGRGDIVIDGVCFSHPSTDSRPRPQVLHDVSLRIPAGRVCAIVGASGSGKSTLASLLVRTWDPQKGHVRIGEVDVRDLPVEKLRDLVAVATQTPHVFNDSLRGNLLLACPDASEEEIERILQAVALKEWIDSEPQGLDTVVAEMGERLSGGQRQRLALARTLLRGAPITILDEATSQLDAATEERVLAGISAALEGETLIVIAHRLSTVKSADQIVVMDAGRVVEVGTWADLAASGGAFAALLAREKTVETGRVSS